MAIRPGTRPLPVREGARKVAKLCRERGVDISEVAIRFCLDHPYVSSTLVGIGSEAQLKANLKLLEREPIQISSTRFVRSSGPYSITSGRRAGPRTTGNKIPVLLPVSLRKRLRCLSRNLCPRLTAGNRLFPVGHLLPFILVTALFFLWGIPNNLNDVLIRQFMKSFAISRFQAGLVQSAFYMGYFLLAMPAALMMRKSWLQGRICHRSLFICVGHISVLARCHHRAL